MDTIILCVDRDNDLGRKVGFEGPIIGFEQNLQAAQKLALKDPTDTDVNALYGALKIAREMGVEIVTLTGDERVGLISDRKVARQLDLMLDKLKPESVIFVSDGLDDEQVIPMIQSRIKIDSVQRIVVRQSKELEKAYFKLANFMKEVMAEPELSRLIFGLPGIILLLLAIGGAQALSWIMAVIGGYLIIKGIGWEDELFNKAGQFVKSLSVERISTLLYFLALVTITLGIAYAYQDVQLSNINFQDTGATLNTIGLFILNSSSLNLVMSALMIIIFARIIDDWKLKLFIQIRGYFNLLALIIVIKVVFESVAKYMVDDEFGFGNFMLYGFIVLISLAAWIKIMEYLFNPEIEQIYKIMKKVDGKEVFESDGKRIGHVTKAVVEDMKLKEIHVKKRIIQRHNLGLISDERITLREKK